MKQAEKPKAQPRQDGMRPIVGKHGTLYGYIDPARRVIEFKRKGLQAETISLDDYLKP